MCDFSKGFKLCTCAAGEIKFRTQEFYKIVKGRKVAVRDKKNEAIPLIYIWRLFTYKGESKSIEMGRYMVPADDIGQGLDAEWIALNLNHGNCFDFDYTPKEGDNLFITQNQIMAPYISFIYTKAKWVTDHYDPFITDTSLTLTGKVIAGE